MKRPRRRLSPSSFLGSVLLLCVACEAPLEGAAWERLEQAITVPSKGTAATLDVASWNVEWFGSTRNGPLDEALQLANARDVIHGTDFDLWGVAEIVSQSAFDRLEGQLPGYAGLLASERAVVGGSTYYDRDEQKVGIFYKSALAKVLGARIILTAHEQAFAGRPPLEVKLRVTVGGVTSTLVVVVLHAKAQADVASWGRRREASAALKSYLDATYPTERVIVVGDFNDDVDASITRGRPSPYENFVADDLRYAFPTEALSARGETSTTGHREMIDHHLATNELASSYVAGSAEVYRVDGSISRYAETTSDHLPVLTRYAWRRAPAAESPGDDLDR